MKIEELSVGDKYMIEVQIADRIEVEDVVQLSAIEGGLIWASVENLIPHNDKYKQALIDLHKAYSKRTVSMSECVNFKEYKKADDDRRLTGLDALKSALALGMELVEGGES